MPVKNTYPYEINGWDEFLFKNYGYGIYEFSLCLAKEITRSDLRYEYPSDELPLIFRNGRRGEIRISGKAVRELEKLKISTMKILSWIYGSLTGEKPTPEDLQEFVSNQPRVQPFLKYVDAWIDDFKEKCSDRTWRRKGRAVETKYKVACIFAQVIKKETPDWGCLDELLWWLYDNLEKTDYYKDILQPNDEWLNRKKLKTEYYIIMKDRERRKSIENSRVIYFPSREVTAYYKGFLAGFRINFGKKYINFSPYKTISKNRNLIRFPNGVIFKERLSLKEAATFLGIPIARIKEMMEKGDLSYWLPQEGQEIMLSRRSLLEWKYQKTTGSMYTDDKSNQTEKTIRIVLSKRDYEGIQ